MHNAYRIVCQAITILALLCLLVGCAAPTATPIPTLSAGATPATTAASPGTPSAVEAAVASPVSTPAPSATPRPPHAPRLLSYVPERGQLQGPGDPIVLRFDQAMDPASTEDAVTISPRIERVISWDDATTLRIEPAAPGYERDTSYIVSIDDSARSAHDMALSRPVVFRFRTAGYLDVAQVYPAPDSEDVPTDTGIRVIFDRPMVPMTALIDQDDLAAPVTFEPAIEGQGEWINTSTWVLEPSERLDAATRYVGATLPDLVDAGGNGLEDAYVWEFETARPRIVRTVPDMDALHISPSAAIEITFNQAMDRQSTEERLTLAPVNTGKAVAGRYAWEENTLTFTPDEPLARAVRYALTLDGGARSANGRAAIGEAFTSTFTLAAVPAVAKVRPSDGAASVDQGEPIRITFTSPISRATFEKGLIISPTASVYTWWEEHDTVANVSTWLRPSTVYTVTLTTDILGREGEAIAREETVSFGTRSLRPYVYLNVPGSTATYNAYAQPVIWAACTNVEQIDLALYALSPSEAVSFWTESGRRNWRDYVPSKDDLLNRWTHEVDAPLDQTVQVSTTLSLGEAPLAPGYYYVNLTSPQSEAGDRHVLVVSRGNLTLKHSAAGDTLVWACDLASGQPIPDATIHWYDAQGKHVAESSTDASGVALATVPKMDPWSPLIAVGEIENDEGIAEPMAVTSNWADGIRPWSFGLSSGSSTESYRAHFYTERMIYRPGQTVHMKGVVRADDDGSYSLPPAGTELMLVMTDSQGNEIAQRTVALSDMGTLDADFELGEDAALGYYDLRAILDDTWFGTGFQVAEYRKPEFQVVVTTDRDEYIQGETMLAEVEASYFFGGPVADATVRWRVMQRPYYFEAWEGPGWYDFADYDYDGYLRSGEMMAFGELIAEGEDRTDRHGKLTIELPVNLSEVTQSQRYTIEFSVVDMDNQEVSGNHTVVAHKGEFYIGLAPAEYVGTTGEKTLVQAITVDTQGITVPLKALDVVVYQHEWYTVQKEMDDGHYYWENEVRDTPVATYTVTSDDLGVAEIAFTPPTGGIYRVRARGLDGYENEVRSSTFLWVSDSHFVNWGRENHERIDLVADAKSYRPGEVAEVLVPSPFEGETVALLTLERGGIIAHRVLSLDTNSEVLRIPIEPEYAPNIYVSVVLVRGMGEAPAALRMGAISLPVSIERQELAVEITTEKETYAPGDTVSFDISTRDHAGEGVSAEVAVQLVDLAVETLAGAGGGDMLNTFYHQRGLGVNTAATLILSIDRHNLDIAPEGKGGGGGGDGEPVRSDFPDTALWAPAVRTDETGHASVSVDLPDNTTTWRLTAQAVNAATQIGVGRHEIVTTLDIMVRPLAPRFLVIGDEPILGAIVHNNTARAMEMTVSLAASGIALDDTPQTVEVPARGRAEFEWPATALAVDQATLRYTVTGGPYRDAVEITLPVYHQSTAETVGTAGQVQDRVVEYVRLPEVIDATQGGLTIRLEPSLAAGMQEALRYLRAYPYDCVEQTVSRFLPNVVTYRALRELAVVDPELEAHLPQQVGVGLQRLYALQGLDGGWGWWATERSSATLTAYVLFGLHNAREAGFVVEERVIADAVGYLDRYLDEHPAKTAAQRDERAAVLMALAISGSPNTLARSIALYEERDSLSLYARAYLAEALHAVSPEETTRTTTLINELVDAAILSASGAHWEEAQRCSWAMNTDTRTTAIVLHALVAVDPENALLANAVRWLMLARESGRWETTQENAWSVLALTDYMVTTGELVADYTYALWLNDGEQASGTVSPTTVDQAIRATATIDALEAEIDNEIVIERTVTGNQEGTGRLYYTAFLEYYVPAEAIEPLDRGIVVQRRYVLADDPDRPIEQAREGDTILVELTLVAPNDLYYFVLEDPIPAGCEPVDTSLLTTSAAAQGPEFEQESRSDDRGWRWRSWATHSELRDERVALFAGHLPRGAYSYSYMLRCTRPGQYKVMPARAYEMYAADVFGRSAGAAFAITQE